MPGPAPKAPELRQRRNKASTRASLRGRRAGGPVRAPALPIRGCPCGGPQPEPKRKKGPGRPRKPKACDTCGGTGVLPWHHQTKGWWSRLWASEMSPEYVEADLDRLYIAAGLIDAFWWGGGTSREMAGEIRQQLAPFGTSPLDRRKLDWTLDKPEPDEQQDQTPGPLPTGTDDARSLLRMVVR